MPMITYSCIKYTSVMLSVPMTTCNVNVLFLKHSFLNELNYLISIFFNYEKYPNNLFLF